jgi:hypothetical protein
MPRLSVLAGPSLDALVPISVNTGIPHDIVSDAFEGQVLAYIKGFADDEGNVLQNEYFQREERKGITWSIQTQGRFLRSTSADDVLFGNTFDRPLKLPWGSSAALKFMNFVDPTLEHDLASSTKPWALSPLISTMPHIGHRRVPLASRSPSPSPATPQLGQYTPQSQSSKRGAINRSAWPAFPPPQSLSDDTAQLHLTLRSPSSSHSPSPSPLQTPLLSRRPSFSGRAATPDSDGSAVPTWATTESFDPGNGGTESPSTTDKYRSKKNSNNRISAASLGSLLSAGHDERRERKERKRTEKFAKHEQAIQELRTADRRRAYFRDASHRQELIFGPDVRTTNIYSSSKNPPVSLRPPHPTQISIIDCSFPFRTYLRPTSATAFFSSPQHCR